MTFQLITGIIFLSAASVLVFRPLSVPSALVAYIGLWLVHQSKTVPVTGNELLFWGIATVMVTGINFLSSNESAVVEQQRLYIAGGTLTGMIAGMLLSSHGGTVAGAAAGAVLGQIAYSRTPHGRKRSSGLSATAGTIIPAIITFSIVGSVLGKVVSTH